MYRVYDNKEKRWVKEDVFISQIGDVFVAKKSRMSKFGYEKMSLVSERRYTVQYGIGIDDKNGKTMYAGDIVRLDIEDDILCMVAYAAEMGAYLLFDTADMKYYPIIEEIMDSIEVVGNILDNPDMMDMLDDDESDEKVGE